MARFIEGWHRNQTALLPECLDDYVEEQNPVRVIDAFIDYLDLASLGFDVEPEATGRPGYRPALLLKIYLYGYINQVQSSRRLERECARNLELIWLTGRLRPDFKTIADFRKDNGPAIRKVCREFIAFCQGIDLLDARMVAIDGSKFKAVNAKARSFTREKLRRKLGEIDAAIAKYLADTAHEAQIGRQELRLVSNKNSAHVKLRLAFALSIGQIEWSRRRSEQEHRIGLPTLRAKVQRHRRCIEGMGNVAVSLCIVLGAEFGLRSLP